MALSDKLPIDVSIGGVAVASPWWLERLSEWGAVFMGAIGLVLVLMRVVISYQEWRLNKLKIAEKE